MLQQFFTRPGTVKGLQTRQLVRSFLRLCDFFPPPGKSGKTMAIENKWSRQCLLPSKDPTADEVEIAWCSLLVFLCRLLWGRFFSLFLEYKNRKNKYCGNCCQLTLLSRSRQLVLSWQNALYSCRDISRSHLGEEGKVCGSPATPLWFAGLSSYPRGATKK